MTIALWRKMHAASVGRPASMIESGHRYGAMLREVLLAMPFKPNSAVDVYNWLREEADKADRGAE